MTTDLANSWIDVLQRACSLAPIDRAKMLRGIITEARIELVASGVGGPQTAEQVAHAVEHLLLYPCLKPSWRLQVLDYVRAGYDENGQRIERSEELDKQMKLLECQECTETGACRDDCPVKPFRDLLSDAAS